MDFNFYFQLKESHPIRINCKFGKDARQQMVEICFAIFPRSWFWGQDLGNTHVVELWDFLGFRDSWILDPPNYWKKIQEKYLLMLISFFDNSRIFKSKVLGNDACRTIPEIRPIFFWKSPIWDQHVQEDMKLQCS